jgi:hypothetical protein
MLSAPGVLVSIGVTQCHSSLLTQLAIVGGSIAVPRKLGIQYPVAIYHVMNRGSQREDILKDDEDRRSLLATLSEARHKTGWQVPAYCLMSITFIWLGS